MTFDSLVLPLIFIALQLCAIVCAYKARKYHGKAMYYRGLTDSLDEGFALGCDAGYAQCAADVMQGGPQQVDAKLAEINQRLEEHARRAKERMKKETV